MAWLDVQSHCPCVGPYTVRITWNSTGVAVSDLFRPGHTVVQSVLVKCLHKWLWAIYQWSLHFLHTVKTNEATLSGLEPITSVMAGQADKPTTGLVLGGGLPSIPADLLKKVTDGSYVELSGFLPETIQESFLYPDGRKKKLTPIDKFTDWVLAFCCFGLASLQANPELGGDLLTFIGTVARLARDHPGPAWAVYEQAFRAKMAANPSLRWNKLDQEVWALAAVTSGHHPSQPAPAKRRQPSITCNRWNDGVVCPFKNCRFAHACAVCHSSSHRAPACPHSASKRSKDSKS